MKTHKFNYKGYQFSVIGAVPTGSCMTDALEYIQSLNASKGTFMMQVIESGTGTISTINFSRIYEN